MDQDNSENFTRIENNDEDDFERIQNDDKFYNVT
jgi:hypothetical protein